MPTDDENLNARFPTRPADKTKWWIEDDGRLCIPNPDGMTITNCMQDYITSTLIEHQELINKVADLERDLNWRNPDRFLDEALKKMDAFCFEAMKVGERTRAEAYAVSVAIMRGYLGDSAEHERRMNRR